MTDFKTLAEEGEIQVFQFCSCGHIGLRVKNTLLNFTKEDFKRFSDVCKDVDFSLASMIFPDSIERLSLKTDSNYVRMCFDKREFEAFVCTLTEANIILEANDLIEK